MVDLVRVYFLILVSVTVVDKLSVNDVVTVKYFFFTINLSEVTVVGTVT